MASVRPVTASTIFGMSRGKYVNQEGIGCYFCGGRCGRDHTFEALEKSFRHVKGRQTGPKYPGSRYACWGCFYSVQDHTTLETPHGPENLVSAREFSWLLTTSRSLACRKIRDIDMLREACIKGMAKPFVIVLSDGERYIYKYEDGGGVQREERGPCDFLWEGVVNDDPTSKEIFVTLNGKKMSYEPTELAARIDLCGKIRAAAFGLTDPAAARQALKERYKDSGSIQKRWDNVKMDNLTELAQWLLYTADECLMKYPADKAEKVAK